MDNHCVFVFFYVIFSFLGITSKSMVSPSSAEMVFLNQSPDFIMNFSQSSEQSSGQSSEQSSEQKRKGFVNLFHGSLFIGVHCDVFSSRWRQILLHTYSFTLCLFDWGSCTVNHSSVYLCPEMEKKSKTILECK